MEATSSGNHPYARGKRCRAGGRVRAWSRSDRDITAAYPELGLPVPGTVQVPPAFPGDAVALLDAIRDQGYEGIVLKRPASLYHPGRRTREWLKVRNIRAIGSGSPANHMNM
jgi:ATP-dependent DNA ligase